MGTLDCPFEGNEGFDYVLSFVLTTAGWQNPFIS